MTQSPQNPAAQLRKCIALAQEVTTHAQANQEFAQLRDSIATQNPQIAESSVLAPCVEEKLSKTS